MNTPSLFAVPILIAASSIAHAERCENNNYAPFAEGHKLVCWIKRNNSNSFDGVFLVPGTNGQWIAWIRQSVYFASPVVMAEVYNDCSGFSLNGADGDQTFSITIGGIAAHLVGAVVTKGSLDTIEFVGECQILSEDTYAIEIQSEP